MDVKFSGAEESQLMHVKKEAGFRNSYASVVFTGRVQGVKNPYLSLECRNMDYAIPAIREAVHNAMKAHVKTLFEGQVTTRCHVGINMMDRSEINIHVRFRHRIPTEGTSTKDLILKKDMEKELTKCQHLIEDAFFAALETMNEHRKSVDAYHTQRQPRS